MPLDLVNNATSTLSLVPLARTADENGTGVDLQGYRSALIKAHVGANGSIAVSSLSDSVKLELELEESADDVTYTDVASSDIVFDGTEPTGTNDGCFAVINNDTVTSTTYKCQYHGDKRYVRGVANFTSTPSIPFSIEIEALEPTHAPV